PNHVLAVNPSACCTYLLYYTDPALTYSGHQVGGRRQFNAKAIRKVEPQVARYELGAIQHVGVRLRGHPRVGRHLRVTHGRWAPRHTHVTYRWFLDGKRLRDHHRGIRVKGTFYGHRLSVHVTGHHRTYHAVTVVSRPRHGIHKGHMHHARLRLKGEHRVGHRLTLELGLKRWHPHPRHVHVTWYRGHHRIHGAHGVHYHLRKKDRGKRIHAAVRATHRGYHAVELHTRHVRIHGRH
ncbi:MAG: hypothetical protein WB797_18320, partial [Nocardioides sp.]